jgi:quinol monooxygenase YgiN
MLVVNRYRVAAGEADEFDAAARRALEALAARPGVVSGQVGRNVGDPGLWVMSTRWQSVGAYRRALSAYDVKLHAVPLMYKAIDEPCAFEDLDGELNESVPRTT